MMTSIKSMVYGEEVDDNTIAMFDQSPSNLVDERSSKTSYPVSSGRQLLDSGAERSLPTTMVKHQPSNAVQHEQFSSWMGESLSRQANKRMRRLVGQSWLTNRFGDASVEEAFCEYLRHHQLKYIKRVLLLFGFLFAALAIYQQSLLNFESDHRGAGGVLEAGVKDTDVHIWSSVCAVAAWALLCTDVGAANWLLAAVFKAALTDAVSGEVADAGVLLLCERLQKSYLDCILSCLDYVWALVDCILVILLFLLTECHLFRTLPDVLRDVALMLLYGARRINRFERQIFLTTVALQGEGDVKRDLIAGKHTALLALFSNPTVPPKLRKALRLEPLRFGQEMRFLLRSVPKAPPLCTRLTTPRPHSPLTGRTCRLPRPGALAFEKANGAIDSSNIDQKNAQFVAMLRQATAARKSAAAAHRPDEEPPGLECVFLNSCESEKLGRAIVEGLPQDIAAAARASDASAARGFAFGDPAEYLHSEPNHPHLTNPDFQNCPGCNPPVHGAPPPAPRSAGRPRAVLLLVRSGGVVREYDGDMADEWLMEMRLKRRGAGGAEPSLQNLLSRDGTAPPLVTSRLMSHFRGAGAWRAQMATGVCVALSLLTTALVFAEYTFPSLPPSPPSPPP
ncbi:hypothetical protein EMIHUDRAFT_467435 [Emiliania huxleyi CCMP1516]|uniref:Uncharacterized protein n=2 Tax=Emiliania huxleyi TaxID=2903 RepID=A0A0D3KHD4_EMIH1|nr:hypothetical protein EMIHUDRAFT_467435 [Emiliania huxleyi CCMP1516]EOD35169.1 hypothetical protein EMIHUDRAFT_467435 [Emiliania huxleyi CCMP1516]|eukprot:XP_005787598.1 hypothetical protein EMIHUDRAFT_467435 [Emiliania huxleyi CCMP1516]